MHGAYKVGEYWECIPNYEHRGICPHCKVPETMEHILLECQVPGQGIIWPLARKILEKKNVEWPVRMNVGTILACATIKLETEGGKPRTGANRLFTMIIAESARLIWLIRCDRRIERQDDPKRWLPERVIHNKWVNMVNQRLTLDYILAKRFEDKRITLLLVLKTWSGILKDENVLHEDWIDFNRLKQAEVLVSIEKMCPTGRQR